MFNLKSLTRLLAPVAIALGLSAFAGAASAQSCPQWQNPGMANMSGSAQQFYTAHTYNVTAGGNVNLQNCNLGQVWGDQPRGYVISQPDFELNYQGNPNYALELSVNSQCDSVILVNDANGNWHFNDDGNGNLDGRVYIQSAPSGTYDIWIGTYNSSTCNAQLRVETF